MFEQATNCRILSAGTPPEKLVIRESSIGGAVFDRTMQHRYLLWRNLAGTERGADGEDKRNADGEGGRDSDGEGKRDSDGEGKRDSDGEGKRSGKSRRDDEGKRIFKDSNSESERTVCFIMLNPNRADEISNDPTIKRCIGFARGWGFLKINVVNLFSVKASTPALLRQLKEPLVGLSNDAFVLSAIEQSSLVIAAWGNHGSIAGRDKELFSLLNGTRYGTRYSGVHANLSPTKVYCLGLTKLNQPKHPLYLGSRLKPVPFVQ